MAKIESVLFVCWGNVCRSPAAELMLNREAKLRGLDNIQIDSAGVGADVDASRPSFSMWWAAFRRGMWLKPKPRLFRKSDFSKYDLIIAMDREVEFSIRNNAKEKPSNVKLLSDFLPDGELVDVPDPMDRSAAVCNLVLDMLGRACEKITAQMVNNSSNANSKQQTVYCNGPGRQLRFDQFEGSTVLHTR